MEISNITTEEIDCMATILDYIFIKEGNGFTKEYREFVINDIFDNADFDDVIHVINDGVNKLYNALACEACKNG